MINNYFTDVMTSLPTNESELQLYRVLQRANLLKYYDSFISHGKTIMDNMDMFLIIFTLALCEDTFCELWINAINVTECATGL